MRAVPLVLLFLSTASAIYYELDSSPDCGASGPVFDVELSCASSGENACVSGDTATVTGTLTIPETGLGNIVKLTNKVCLLGIQTAVTCKEHSVVTNLCGAFDLEQYGCPDPGEYTLDGDFIFPKANGVDVGKLWMNTFVVVYTTITSLDEEADGSDTYTCSTKVNVYKGDSSASGSSYMVGFSVVMLAGLGALVYKRRRTAKIDLTKEEAMLGDFEMMNDTIVVEPRMTAELEANEVQKIFLTMKHTPGDLQQQIVSALQPVLASIEDLDDDMLEYMAGMLASHVDEDPGSYESAIGDVLSPFLESMHCPGEICEQTEAIVLELLRAETTATTGNHADTNTARKLLQGVVNMGNDLVNKNDHEAQQLASLWGTDKGVKAMANTLIDAQTDKSSAKDKRRARKAEAETARKLLQSQKDTDLDQETSGNLVNMSFLTRTGNAGVDKKRDVLVRNVTLSLPNGTTLLENGELKFAYQRRYGLIGENGVGKSTLLRAINRQEIEGFPVHLRVLHVRQEVPSHIAHDMTVMQAVLNADMERSELIEAEKALIAKLEGADITDEHLTIEEKRKKLFSEKEGTEHVDVSLKKLDEIYSRLQLLGSDNAEARAAMILAGLQFSPEKQHALISSLSGGWKMRVALAAALFVEPEICMLDEPTNHLDLEAVLWLEEYLTTYKHTLVVVSHDRGFLNEVCTDIMELKHKNLTYYRGNFDTYVKLKDENIRNAMRVYEAYHTKREHMMEFITKFRANAKRATMVQSRIKAVEKMDAEAPKPVEVDQVWRFAIPNSEPLGPPIIAINDVFFDYNAMLPDGSRKSEDQFLLQKVNFGVDLTSKIAVLGRNGQGKTTLLNLIMGRLKPIKGSVSINSVLRVGHFTQHSADNFDLKLSAVENLLNQFAEAEDQELRSFLGRFQIQGNDALKPMLLLSGGQKSRVAFAALAYKRPHVLIIDEGSNHLSMEAVDALIEAIQDFKGGIMVVSHDEYFVSKICNELWVVDSGHVTRFRGDFEDYKKQTAEDTRKRVEQSVRRLKAANN